MAAAMAGGKGKKKKWSKGKNRDKVDNKVLFTKEQYDRLNSEVPKMKLITVSTVVEKLKISGGLARRALIIRLKSALRQASTIPSSGGLSGECSGIG